MFQQFHIDEHKQQTGISLAFFECTIKIFNLEY